MGTTDKKELTLQRRSRIVVGSLAVAIAAVLGTGVAGAAMGGGDDDERPITGDALARASAAALAHTGGGRVTDTEEGDEESLYEVEVTRTDGSQVDVQVDADFKVVGSEGDDDSAEDGAGDD